MITINEEPVTAVQIDIEALQDLLEQAYLAGCYAVHDHYQPCQQPEFGEAATDYVSFLDLTAITRPVR